MGFGNVQQGMAVDQVHGMNMKKQVAPTELQHQQNTTGYYTATQGYPPQTVTYQTQGGRVSYGSQGSGVPGYFQPGTTQGLPSGQGSSQRGVNLVQGLPIVPNAQPAQTHTITQGSIPIATPPGRLSEHQTGSGSKPSAQASESKIPVPSESSYPKPNKTGNLMRVLAQEPERFEQFLGAMIEAAISKRLHDKLVPFKVEVGNFLEKLGKSNIDEVSSLSKAVQSVEASLRGQERQMESLGGEMKVAMSHIKLLQNNGTNINNSHIEEGTLEKLRENMRAELSLLVTQKLQDTETGIEDRVTRKLEEAEKRLRQTEKRAESVKAELDDQKQEQDAINAKLADMQKLVTELTIGSDKKDAKEEVSSVLVNCR